MKRFFVLLAFSLVGCASVPSPTAIPSPAPLIQFRDDYDKSRLQWMEKEARDFGLTLSVSLYPLRKDAAFLFGSFRTAAGSLRSVILRSNDGGQHWAEVAPPLPGNAVLWVTFLEDGGGWALLLWTVEDPGSVTLYHSTDYGQNWERLSDVPKWQYYGYPLSLTFFDAKHGQIEMHYWSGSPTTDRVAVLTTEDGGQSWEETSSLTLEAYETREKIPAPTELVGHDGSLWRLDGQKESPQLTVSRRLPSEDSWTVMSILPAHFKYVDGRVRMP